MNFFGQSKSGKIIITPPATAATAARPREGEDDPSPGISSAGCGSLRRRLRERERETKFAKDNYVVVPIELTGYRSYNMEHLELESKSSSSRTQGQGQAQAEGLKYEGHEARGETNEETAFTAAVSPMELELGFRHDGDEAEGDREDEVKKKAMVMEDLEVSEEQQQDDYHHEQEEEDRRPLFDGANDGDDQTPEPELHPTSVSASVQASRPISTSATLHQKAGPTLSEPSSTTNIRIFTKNRTNIQIFQSFVHFGFFIGLIPFRFQTIDRLRWKLKFYAFKPQRVFCAFVHILVIFFAANKWTDPQLYTIFNNNAAAGSVRVSMHRAEYLKFALAVSETLYVHVFILILWSKRSTFQWLAESYPPQHLIQPIHGRYHKFMTAMQNKFLVSTALISLACFVGVESFIAEYRELDPDEDTSLFGEDGYIVRQGKSFIFIDPDNHAADVNVDEVHPVVAYTAATLYVFSGFMYAMMIGLAHLFNCVLALMVYDVGAHFVQQLKSGGLKPAQALELYGDVKRFIHVINDGLGILTLLIALSIVPYVGFNAPIVFAKNEHWLSRLVAILLILNYFLFMWAGVKFITQIKRLRVWLGKRTTTNGSIDSSSFPISRAQSIYTELADDPSGLSGCGLFTVSSAFVGALVQLLTIYAFIVIGQDHPQNGDRPLSWNTLGIENGNSTGSGSSDAVPGLEFVE